MTNPQVRRGLVNVAAVVEGVRNAAASMVPALLKPDPRFLTVAITAKCNLRCEGCRYGRDYMPNAELPTETVLKLLGDAADAGMSSVRLYGGEPLLHAGLPLMVKESVRLGMKPYISTKGILLERCLEPLVNAGLRMIKFGYYGQDDVYDSYVARRGAWRKFEAGIFAARARYGSLLDLHLAYVLSTKTSALSELRKARAFAEAHSMKFHVDLIHYSLPYFTEGTDRVLQFTDRDRSVVDRVVVELKTLKRERPDLYEESDASIHSIPDWLLKGPGMRVALRRVQHDLGGSRWVGSSVLR